MKYGPLDEWSCSRDNKYVAKEPSASVYSAFDDVIDNYSLDMMTALV